MFSIEVLAVTMNAKNFELVKKMNINGAAIIANQDNRNDSNFYSKNEKIKMITTATRGVGRNRNICLLNASADICILADDDMVFDNDYEKIVFDAFSKIPDADIIIFNLDTVGEVTRNRRNNHSISKVRRFNAMNYGAARIAFRLQSIQKANIFFSVLFGGGCPYSSGEDTLFLYEAIKKGLNIYTYPKRLATVTQNKSSWFEGYTEKYFCDKGVLYYSLSHKKIIYIFLCIQDAIRHRNIYKKSVKNVIKLMLTGIKMFKIK